MKILIMGDEGRTTSLLQVKHGQVEILREALQTLVELYDHKQNHGETDYYKEKKVKAWAMAREALKINQAISATVDKLIFEP